MSPKPSGVDEDSFLYDLLQGAGDFLYLVDGEKRVHYVSPAFENIYGLPCDNWRELYLTSEQEIVFLGPESRVVTSEIAGASGGARLVESVERRRKRNNKYEWVGVGRDVTLRSLTECERRRAYKLEALGRLSGGISHDLNEYLTVIGCEADLLAEGSHGESAKVILESTERATELSQRLMLFGRESAHEMSLVDLTDATRDAMRLFGRMLPDRINVELDLGARGKVLVPPTELCSVLMNLLVNAVDAMAAGGRLRITTADINSNSEIALLKEGEPVESVVLSVEDTGEGMSFSVRERMFDPFFTTRGAGDGKGMGLAVVYGTVQRLGGTTRVYSEIGRGTRIDVLLPRNEGEKVLTAPLSERPPGKGELILLVEDDQRVRSLTTRVLERSGYQVLALGNPIEALELDELVLASVSMMLSDVIMPELSGPELYEKLRERRANLPVVFVTGYSSQDLWGEAFDGTGFLRKPWRREDLLQAIQQCLLTSNKS